MNTMLPMEVATVDIHDKFEAIVVEATINQIGLVLTKQLFTTPSNTLIGDLHRWS
jgi:hypothetical protein